KLAVTQATGKAASDAQLPGAIGNKPVPNQVASSAAGCQGGRPRERARTLSPARRWGRGERDWRQAYGGDRLRGDTLATAGKAEFIGCRRLDADAAWRDAEDRGDPLDHRRPVGADLWPLADDRHVDSGDRSPSLAD